MEFFGKCSEEEAAFGELRIPDPVQSSKPRLEQYKRRVCHSYLDANFPISPEIREDIFRKCLLVLQKCFVGTGSGCCSLSSFYCDPEAVSKEVLKKSASSTD